MYELSARNDNVILYDKRNQKNYVLDFEDVDQIVDNNNKLKSDEIIEKYLKFKTEPVVVQQQLKAADIKSEYEAMRELYESKVSTQIIDNFINKFKLSNDELRKLEAFPDSKTIDTFERDDTTKNNIKKEFKIMVEKIRKDTNIKTEPFLYMKYYFGTKIIKSDNVFIQQQLSNLLKEPWKYADLNYITPEEVDRLKRHAPYKNLASLVFSVRRPVFDGINFMKIMSLLKIYNELKNNYFNKNISRTNYRSIYTDYNKNDKYLNFNIWTKDEKKKKKNKKISFSVKNRILYIFNIKGFRFIHDEEYLKEILKSITPKIYALVKYLLISEPSENHYKITINLFGNFNGKTPDEFIFSDTYLIYKIEKNNNGRVEQIQKKARNTLWDNINFRPTIEEFKRLVEESDTEREITTQMNNLMKTPLDETIQDGDSSDNDGAKDESKSHNIIISKTTLNDDVKEKSVDTSDMQMLDVLFGSDDENNDNREKSEQKKDYELTKKVLDKKENKFIDENTKKDDKPILKIDESFVNHLDKTYEKLGEKTNEELEGIKERNEKRIKKKLDQLYDQDLNSPDDSFWDTYNAFIRDMKNAKIKDNTEHTGNKYQREVFSTWINPLVESELEAEGRLKLYSSGWTDKTLTRIDDLLTQLKKSSGYNIPRQHFALGWTDKTLTRIDDLLTQLK